MEKKFTQGRWYINGQNSILSNIQEEGDVVCFSPKKYDASMKNWDANAKLIVAAKDLLEACLAAKAMYEAQGINENSRIGGEQYTKLLEAIKKALE